MKLIFPCSYVYVLLFLLGIIPPLPQIGGYSHWIVTQHGALEPITDSYYSIRRPGDLLALLRQEADWEFVRRVELRLNKVSSDLQANQEYQSSVQRHYVEPDSACVRASRILSDFDGHSNHILTLESKGISSGDYLRDTRSTTAEFQQPICGEFFTKNFSMCCFEHLDSIRNRARVDGVPEMSLYKIAVPQQFSPDQYGHLVALSLRQDFRNPSRNWVLYNMAGFYWRIKGIARNAIDCIRAALHSSPVEFQDIALVSLANILHQIKSASQDAIILMKNALAISPQFSGHHLLLGNIYATLGQFNYSLYHYSIAAEIHQSDRDRVSLKEIEERIFAAKCSHELNLAISIQQQQLDKQLEQLETFQSETNRFQESKISLSRVKETSSGQKTLQTIYESFLKQSDSKTLTPNTCLIIDLTSKKEFACEPELRSLITELFHNPQFESKPRVPVKPANQPQVIKTQKFDPDFYRSESQTSFSKSVCKSLKCDEETDKKTDFDRYLSIYFSPANKGFDLKTVLTEKQGLCKNDEHQLPWYPPYCSLYVNSTDLSRVELIDRLELLKHKNSIRENVNDAKNYPDKILLYELLKFVQHNKNVRLEDIGQRIITAIKNRLNPQWILFSMAGLYWRVVGNLVHALECNVLSVKLSPVQYRDVSFVNLAVVLAKLHKYKDSLKLIKAALEINYSEPETHFVAANLYKEKKKFNRVYHHLEMAVKRNSSYLTNASNMEFVKCQLCKSLHQANFTKHSLNKNLAWKDNVTQVFINYKMCSSITECSNIVAENYQFLPHIKVTIKGPTFSPSDIEQLVTSDLNSMSDNEHQSHIMYGILWNTNLSNLHIQEHDCLLINDSSRSVGCHRNEDIFSASQHAIEFLAELKSVIDNMSKMVVDNFSAQQQESTHICDSDRPKRSKQDDSGQQTLRSTTTDIQDTIINLIPSRVVLNPLAPEDCEHVAPFDFKTYTPLYVSLNTMRINVISLLDSLTPGYSFSFNQHPYCAPKGVTFLRKIIEKYQIDFDTSQYSRVPEYNLHASFLKTFDDKYSLEDIGKRLHTGIEQNATDWRLATIIVNYWRVVGDSQQAFNCLELAMENSPEFHEKVILVNAANILYRINKLEAALEVSHRSMQYPDSQNWIVIPFLVANIFATMEQWHKATLFYEACLSLKADFDEAIYRIKSIQCQQMVLHNLEQH